YCPRILTSIYPSKDRVVKVGIAVGTIMKDPIPSGLYWVTYDFSDINEVVSYKTLEDFELDIFQEKLKLPFFCEGTGHTVYKNYFYCQKMMTNKIVRYNLMESRWLGELELPGAGAHNAYPYQSDRFSDIDFATDEYGLWVIYASSASSGNVVISKINEDNFTISETWTTLIPKRTVGNTFMICGILYATDSYTNSPTYIKYIYNTQNGGNKELKSTEITFTNTIRNEFVSNYMLDYNPLDRKLYSWNHGRIEIYSTMSSTIDK
ncbi:noelin-3-like, partial [Saccostrea cucullata]|uniref:noelin-3-like n=1 Tax=Saccostrea cuccullata TaxID=36930 RepID=UPI002ED2AE91